MKSHLETGQVGLLFFGFPVTMLKHAWLPCRRLWSLARSLAHVKFHESCLMQLLPEVHLQLQVVVGIEDQRAEDLVIVVARVLPEVWSHEAVRAHLVTGVQCS